MEAIEHFVDRLTVEIGGKCHRQVDKKAISDGYHIKAGRVVGWVRKVERGRVVPDNCFPIQVKETDLRKANMAQLADRHDTNGWWGEAAAYFYVLDGDIASYRRAVRALVAICLII